MTSAPARRPLVLAYLTNVYARASDSFIRAEVHELRSLGHTVHTFSIRPPVASELVSDEIRAEHASTRYLLSPQPYRQLARGACALLRSRRAPHALCLAVRTSAPGLRARAWQIAYLLEAGLLAEELRKRGVEHLHDHIGEGSASVAMLASTLTGIPFSLTVHGPNEFDHPHEIALPEKVRRSAFTVTVSCFGRSQVLRWLDRRWWEKVHVVHCGVTNRFLPPDAPPLPDAPRLVSIGRLAEDKGQLVLLEALAGLAREGICPEVVLVGDGPLRPILDDAIRRLGLRDLVRLPGWLTGAEIAQLLADSTALVVASFAEGLPVVIMEAFGLGRPVVATNVGGTAELVRPGLSGWLVPPGSVDRLTETLRELLTAPRERLAAAGLAGREQVVREHDTKTETARLAALFHDSVGGGRRS